MAESNFKSIKPTPSSQGTEVVSSGEFRALQQSYENWAKLRKVSVKLFEDLINARNKASHVRQSSLSALGLTTSSSRISLQVFDEVSNLMNSLEEVQRKMSEELEKIKEIQQGEKSSLPIDESYLQELLQQLQQQSSLEETLRRRLSENVFSASLDHDMAVTMMACLSYPPYFKRDDVRMLIELGKKDDK
jgi:hypothetical protein